MKLNRRKLLQVSGVAGLSGVVTSSLSRSVKAQKNQKTRLVARVDAGLQYFKEAAEQLPLVEALASADCPIDAQSKLEIA